MYNTQHMEQKFRELVEAAQTIIVTSHIAPDPDAVSSSLLLTRTLRLNYSDKSVHLVFEEPPAAHLEFLEDYDTIEFRPMLGAMQELKPGLFIVTDACNYNRVSRSDYEAVEKLVTDTGIKTAIVDHHEVGPRFDATVFINHEMSSCAQEIYNLCFTRLGMQKPPAYEQVTMLGVLTDTGRFKYPHPKFRDTFAFGAELVAAGANIEKIESQLEYYSAAEIDVLSHLAANMHYEKSYNYSFITDEYRDEYMKAGKPYSDLKGMCNLFNDQYVRATNGNQWGFVVYPDPAGPDCYRVSFRAKNGAQDVSVLAVALGGGGHPPAAAAPLKAESVEGAIKNVQAQIKQVQ